jgi:uncharacterized protein (DUF302 family)
MSGFFGKMLLAAGMAATLSSAAVAADMPPSEVATTYTVEGDFEDVRFALENAIVNRGLVIDYVSHLGDMLARTGADVGAKKDIYTNAESMLFCSAVLSRAAMEADPANIAFCPYGVFVYETPDMPGTIVVGYRNLTETGDEASKKAIADVNALLNDIVKEASE